MQRLVLCSMLCALVFGAACGGDDGGGSTTTGDGGSAGSAADGGGGGKAGNGSKAGNGGNADGGGGTDGGGAGSSGKDGGDHLPDGGMIPDSAAPVDATADAYMEIIPDSNFAPCTTLEPSTQEVTPAMAGGSMPAAVGGTIEDGLYVLTDYDVYAPGVAGSGVLRREVKIAGDDLTVVYLDGTQGEQDNVGTFTTSGSTLTFTITCPSDIPLPVMLSYSATATTFTLFDADKFSVATYTKQ